MADGSRLIGTWKLKAIYLENVDTKERRLPYGEKAIGYLVLTPDRLMALVTPENQKEPHTDADRLHNYWNMIAYSGRYRIEGDRWVTRVDVSWNHTWKGTDQVRFFRFEGDELHIITPPMAMPLVQWDSGRAVLVWVRDE